MDKLQSHLIDLESQYEGDIGSFATNSPTYSAEVRIAGDENNVALVTYCSKTKKELSRIVQPKKVFAWQSSK